MGAGGLDTVGSPAFTHDESTRYRAAGWWADSTLSDAVRRNAEHSPDRCAYADDPGTALTWREFDCSADALAGQLAGVGVERGDRVAVWHGDSAAIHALFVAIERCGAVVVGIGARAGTREVAAILHTSQPKMLVSDAQRNDDATRAAGSSLPVVLLTRGSGGLRLDLEAAPGALPTGRPLGP